MRKVAKTILGLALAGVLIWGLLQLIPSDEKRIQKRLQHLAEVITLTGKEGNIARTGKFNSFGAYFTMDTEISLEAAGLGAHTFHGRDEVLETAKAVIFSGSGVSVQFDDIVVKVAPDKQTATADLTAKVTVGGDRDFTPVELRFTLKRTEGVWLIARVEMLKTFVQ